jgi:HTH-type transcriptional regulator/antitoxin HipB
MELHIRKATDIAAVVKAAREDSNMSQAELAHNLAFPRDYMVDLESGEVPIYAKRLLRVMHELGITMTLSFDAQGEDG